MSSFIFLRPWFLLGLLPVVFIAIYWWFRPQKHNDWQKFCEPQLLAFLQKTQASHQWLATWGCIIASLIFMLIGLAGPSWHRDTSIIGQTQKPVMIVLDLSTNMLLDDITPSRLERAKFLIEDLLKVHQDLQWGVMVFSQVPFLVSPITNDIQNILNFLSTLSPSILPVGGHDDMRALDKAKGIMQQAGYSYGKIIVISSKKPSAQALKLGLNLKTNGYEIFWVLDSKIRIKNQDLNLIDIQNAESTLGPWLTKGGFLAKQEALAGSPLLQWQDEGRWFIFFSLLCLFNVFRRGWFIRLWV